MRWHYKEGFDVVFLEEGVPFVTISRLHLVISVEALQRRSGDVDLPVGFKGEIKQRLAAKEMTKPFSMQFYDNWTLIFQEWILNWLLTLVVLQPPSCWPESHRWTTHRTAISWGPALRTARGQYASPRACLGWLLWPLPPTCRDRTHVSVGNPPESPHVA